MKLSSLKPRIPMHQSGPARLVTVGWSDDRRKSRQERGYGAAWDKLRLVILKRDQYLCKCQDCTIKGLLRPATEVDHIISKAEWRVSRGTLTGVDGPSNLQAINFYCHKRKTAGEFKAAYAVTGKLQGRHESRPLSQEVEDRRLPKDLQPSRVPLSIVCGPPASGKSTYLRQHVGPKDVVIDLDQIIQELSGLPVHHTPREWLVPGLEERNRRLRALASDTEHERAWFVVSAPNPMDRMLWAKMLNAEVKLLATPIRVCIARIKADPSRAGQEERMIAAVRSWWEMNQ